MLSLGKEAMEGPSCLYLPLALSRSLSLSLALLGQGSDGRTLLPLLSSRSFPLPLPLPCSPWARKRWKDLLAFTFLSLFLAPSPSPLLSLGEEGMEGPSCLYPPLLSLGNGAMEGPSCLCLPLALSSSLSLSLAFLGRGSDGRTFLPSPSLALLRQGSDGSTFLPLPSSRSFSLPLPLLCSPWTGERWKDLPPFTFLSLFLAPSPSLLLSLGKEALEGPSCLHLPRALSRFLSLALALLGQRSDVETFLLLPSLRSFSDPYPCFPWARKRWKDLPRSLSFSLPLRLPCSPETRKRWKDVPLFTFLSLVLALSRSLSPSLALLGQGRDGWSCLSLGLRI